MADAVLVLNAGSSSLKFSAFPAGGGAAVWRGAAGGLGDDDADRDRALAGAFGRCRAEPAGHRFTGGIGGNAAAIRERVVRDAAWLGTFRVQVIPTDEELMTANHTRRVLHPKGRTS